VKCRYEYGYKSWGLICISEKYYPGGRKQYFYLRAYLYGEGQQLKHSCVSTKAYMFFGGFSHLGQYIPFIDL